MLDANFVDPAYTGNAPCLVGIASPVSLTRKSVSRCPVFETSRAASAKHNWGSVPKACGTELAVVPATFINDPQQRSFCGPQ